MGRSNDEILEVIKEYGIANLATTFMDWLHGLAPDERIWENMCFMLNDTEVLYGDVDTATLALRSLAYNDDFDFGVDDVLDVVNRNNEIRDMIYGKGN